MNIKQIGIIIYVTVLAFSVLYSPQPILPTLIREFHITSSQAALLTSVTMIPLSFSPIFFGFILESFTAKKLLRLALLGLTITELGIYMVSSFKIFLLLRFLQGFMLPAILTSIMTYISVGSEKGLIQKIMAIYIASTILGGFLGRFVSGGISHYFGWRYSFLVLFISLVISLVLTFFLESDSKLRKSKFIFSDALKLIKTPPYVNMYITIFCTFFTFASMLNFLPFRLTEISSAIDEFQIGMIYSGYIMGILVSLTSPKVIKLLGSEKRTILTGLAVFLFSVPLFSLYSIKLLFFSMFIFCAGMFTVHSVESGYLNKIARNNKGVVNGVYVSAYYTGGVLGTYFPGFIYKAFGWNFFLAALSFVIISGILSILLINSSRL
ncbi:MFS transporter [Flexistipes sinusarabici]|uniref:MFS transporter n=1 Tax=Flexistipes sinusarabici TaxID=2352 RepID=UPI00235205DB|nr:MFS transporter [Flexistipes sinusarabici]